MSEIIYSDIYFIIFSSLKTDSSLLSDLAAKVIVNLPHNQNKILKCMINCDF